MSDDEEVILLQVCANKQCLGIEDLEFDEETGEMYCVNCRALYARTAKEGFRILLAEDEEQAVRMIFDRFDGGKGYWTYQDFVRFQDAVGSACDCDINSDEALRQFFKDEFDIDISQRESGEYVVWIKDLENMYGGYVYNNINALHKDCDTLENARLINTALLE
ncbi:hypothetical protein ERJ75_001744400 [Trypanosoma vivax]|uniref:Uncharacterized protein n=1 Tax=Trypanosoma vivax (strain Y486) TaxID=1055687 RepID=G0U2R5_TRYVY|nr:hypothetical protein TRVL_02043 [Trypanosoma vivax]KAH8604339.1 hypothetical protein ERJ75_001744400 [Trypanosoma vivax]CCC50569.1 conserved hypothetical protein [Trypanosoma vivax Y486]